MKKLKLSLFLCSIAFLFMGVLLILIPKSAKPAKASNDPPTVYGEFTDKLFINKSVYTSGDAVMVKAYICDNDLDFVGIYAPSDVASRYWYYIKDVGEGNTVNILQQNDQSYFRNRTLPAGEYRIRIQKRHVSSFDYTACYADITVLAPQTPLSATYTLKNNTDGYAAGTVTVTMPSERGDNLDIIMYWGNSSGKLPGYGPLTRFKVTGDVSSFTFNDNTIIPNGADRLFVYSSSRAVLIEESYLSTGFVTVMLPQGACMRDFGDPLYEFAVISDLHVQMNLTDQKSKNFKLALQSLKNASPNLAGIIANGDIIDCGHNPETHYYEPEFQNVWTMYNEVFSSGYKPPMMFSVGNHDLWGGPWAKRIELFKKYSYLPDGSSLNSYSNPLLDSDSLSYDFYINGYHFIVLGDDDHGKTLDGDKKGAGLTATLYANTLQWLDQKLAEDYRDNKPTFLFLHQSIYNSVAGSLPSQGWDGVANEADFINVIKKYPNAVYFASHSHWPLDDPSSFYDGGENLPYIINTCTTAEIISDYVGKASGTARDTKYGGQGMIVKVYKNKLVITGRAFLSDVWMPGFNFVINYPIETTATFKRADGSVYTTKTVTLEEDFTLPVFGGSSDASILGWQYNGSTYSEGTTMFVTDENPVFVAKEISFSAVKGARLRLAETIENSGLRFEFRFNTSQFNEIQDSVAEYGAIIVPEDYLSGKDFTIDNFVVGSTIIKAVADVDKSQTYGEDTVYHVAITNLKVGNYNRKFAVRGYIKLKDGRYIYTGFNKKDNCRSVAYLASFFRMFDTEYFENLYQYQIDIINTYAYYYDADKEIELPMI